MEDIFISLGTNLGDKKQNLMHACAMLEAQCGNIVQKSAIYQTEPWGFESTHLFLNQVVQISSFLQANVLLEKLLIIETESGRIRNSNGRYIDRFIDLDILFFGSEIVDGENLKIPHPRIEERKFILRPMAEIAPSFVHPTLKKNMVQLLKTCTDDMKINLYDH